MTRKAPTRRDVLKGGGAFGLGGLLFGVSGCSTAPPAAQGNSSAAGGKVIFPAPSLTTLVGNAPLHVAMAQGFFAAAGVDVEFADVVGTDVIRTVKTKSIMGVAGALPSLVAFAKGAKDVRIIGPSYSAAQTTFIAPKDSPINSVKDLKAGMKVGASVAATPPTYFAGLLAAQAGLQHADLQTVTLGRAPDAWTAAKQGLVAVTWSNPPFSTQLVKSGQAKVIVTAAQMVPDWVDLVLISTASHIQQSPEQIRVVREAVAKAQNLLRTDPDTAAAAWAKNAKLDPAAAAAAIKAVPAAAWTTSITPASLGSVIKAGAAMRLLPADVNAAALLSTAFPAS